MTVNTERVTHGHEGEIAVFLIGMRFTKPWRVDAWLPVFLAMPTMLRELYIAKVAAARGEGEDLGFLDARTLLGGRGVTLIQYWRSVDDIYRYATSPEHAHRPAWQAFNAKVRKAKGAVGIWHETYAVPAGAHESLYVGMPPTGLGKAFGLTEDRSRRRPARIARTARRDVAGGTAPEGAVS
jgi:hypothetical protein